MCVYVCEKARDTERKRELHCMNSSVTFMHFTPPVFMPGYIISPMTLCNNTARAKDPVMDTFGSNKCPYCLPVVISHTHTEKQISVSFQNIFLLGKCQNLNGPEYAQHFSRCPCDAVYWK